MLTEQISLPSSFPLRGLCDLCAMLFLSGLVLARDPEESLKRTNLYSCQGHRIFPGNPPLITSGYTAR
jgi:hypothetical protein